jgi:hypothetical protein
MTTTSVYEVPDNPADVEAAALDLLAHMPGEVFNAPDAMTAVLQEFAGCFSSKAASPVSLGMTRRTSRQRRAQRPGHPRRRVLIAGDGLGCKL